jgi:hypothetical protein
VIAYGDITTSRNVTDFEILCCESYTMNVKQVLNHDSWSMSNGHNNVRSCVFNVAGELFNTLCLYSGVPKLVSLETTIQTVIS